MVPRGMFPSLKNDTDSICNRNNSLHGSHHRIAPGANSKWIYLIGMPSADDCKILFNAFMYDSLGVV